MSVQWYDSKWTTLENAFFFFPKKNQLQIKSYINWLFRVPFAYHSMPSIFRPTSQLLWLRFVRSKEGIEASHGAKIRGNVCWPSTKGQFSLEFTYFTCLLPQEMSMSFFFDAWVFTCKLPHEFLSDIDLSSFYEYKHIPKLMFEWWTLKKKAIESILLLVPMSRLWREQIHFLSRYVAFYFSMFGRTSQKREQPLDHLRFIQGLHARSWFVPSFLFWA